MNLDVGPGPLWLHRVVARPGVEVVVTAQRRASGDVETILLVGVADDVSAELPGVVSDLALGEPPLRAPRGSRYGEGVWQRVPGALKRPVHAVWYRQLHDQHPGGLVVDVPLLSLRDRVRLPGTLPVEVDVEGWGTTSGLLASSRVTLLRLSIAEPGELAPGPPFRVRSASADLLGVLYFNGPDGWLDAIAAFSSASITQASTLSIEVEPI